VYVLGDLLLEGRKCIVCERYNNAAIPPCIAECPVSEDKIVLEEIGVEQKRTQAANALSFLRF
jgi:ferredoxin